MSIQHAQEKSGAESEGNQKIIGDHFFNLSEN